MILAVHFLTGATIALKTQGSLIGLVFAFLSHYLLDIIPHQEYSIKNIKEKKWKSSFYEFLKISLDILLGIFIIVLLLKRAIPPYVFWGGFLGILPDGITMISLIFPKNKILQKHAFFHCWVIHYFINKKISPFWRVSYQVLIVFISILLIPF